MGYIDEDIKKERARQDRQWGEQNHFPQKWLTILMEEVGEVASAILERDYDGYRNELVQVAAVAIAALEAIDRYEQSDQYKYDYLPTELYMS